MNWKELNTTANRIRAKYFNGKERNLKTCGVLSNSVLYIGLQIMSSQNWSNCKNLEIPFLNILYYNLTTCGATKYFLCIVTNEINTYCGLNSLYYISHTLEIFGATKHLLSFVTNERKT
jgi:hypothetical protein